MVDLRIYLGQSAFILGWGISVLALALVNAWLFRRRRIPWWYFPLLTAAESINASMPYPAIPWLRFLAKWLLLWVVTVAIYWTFFRPVVPPRDQSQREGE